MIVSPILIMGVCAWAAAQVLKFIISIIAFRKVDIKYLYTGGGMPSSHSALVCACSTGTAFAAGLDSPLFAIVVLFSFIVMYDAANVRRETGKQSKILNYIMKDWANVPPEVMDRELKELLGHTPLQVLVGAALGVAVGLIGGFLAYGS